MNNSLLATLASVIALSLYIQPAIGNEVSVREIRDSGKQMLHQYDKKTYRRIATYFDDPERKGQIAKIYVRDANNTLTKILHADQSYTTLEYSRDHSDVTLRKSNGSVFNLKIDRKQKSVTPVSMSGSGKFDSTFKKFPMSIPKLRNIILIDDDDTPPSEGEIEDGFWEDFVIDYEVEIIIFAAGPACYAACNATLTSWLPFCNGFPPGIRQECIAAVYSTYGWCMIGCLVY